MSCAETAKPLLTRVGQRKHKLNHFVRWHQLVSSGEYNLTIHLRCRCGLMSNYL